MRERSAAAAEVPYLNFEVTPFQSQCCSGSHEQEEESREGSIAPDNVFFTRSRSRLPLVQNKPPSARTEGFKSNSDARRDDELQVSVQKLYYGVYVFRQGNFVERWQ